MQEKTPPKGIGHFSNLILGIIAMITFVILLWIGTFIPYAYQFFDIIDSFEKLSNGRGWVAFEITLLFLGLACLALPVYVIHAAALRTLVDRVRHGE